MLACLSLGAATALASPTATATALPAALPPATATAAQAFLTRYLLPEGRVSRLDQGGDTVSGGQAQAMLVEVALGDRAGFARTWAWTRANLQRRDGLLSSMWAAGRVVDPQPASDADLDAARALILAARRFHAPSYRRAGLRLARAVLALETAVRGGRRVLLAGPWAAGSGIVAPGYWSPRTFELLRAATGDRRFSQLESSAVALARALTSAPARLPSDWAKVSARGAVTAVQPPPPHAAAPIEYGLVAARLPIRFQEACAPAARAVSASLWPFFSAAAPSAIGVAYSTAGAVLEPSQGPITLLAAASAAQAAGQATARESLLAQARAVDAHIPTYYGAAWIAITEIQLTSSALGGC